MAGKHHRPEGIGATEATEATCCRWRSESGGLGLDQVKRLKLLEQESNRLRRAVAGLTLEKLVLREAASGNSWAPLLTTRAPQGRRACVAHVTAKLGPAPLDAAQTSWNGRRRPCDDLVVRRRR